MRRLGLVLAGALAVAAGSIQLWELRAAAAPGPPVAATPPADGQVAAPVDGRAPTPAAGATTTPALVAAIATLAGIVPTPTFVAEWVAKLDGGTTVDAYIDEVLRSPRFSREIVPSMLFGAFVNVRNYYALPSGFVLRRTTGDGAPRYFLRAPCTDAEGVIVHPWWDLASEVKVCPDSYRPEKWTMETIEHTYRSRMPLSCDSQVGSPELETRPLCGCGPNLIRCLRDEQQYEQFNRSLMDEVKLTTAYVVEHDLPIKELFTGNATFRDRNVELYYRRQKIGALKTAQPEAELAALGPWSASSEPAPPAAGAAVGADGAVPAPWPAAGQWAPREELAPGQHAGVLTAPQVLHWLPDQRQRQRGYYEVLWCTMRNSFGATTKKVLDLNATGNIAFVHDSWERLAHTEICTNCHARLDYGFQFFGGYPDSRASTHFNPSLQSSSTGPLYGRDIEDERGTGPLTPQGFAQLATAQPDFAACMSNHVAEYVLGDRATPDDARAIAAAMDATGTFKAVMKVALERYAEHWRAAVQQAPAPAPLVSYAPVRAEAPTVTIPAALRVEIDRLCIDCHDEAPYGDTDEARDHAFDFRPVALPRALVVSMVDHVAFGTMPKDDPLPLLERDPLVRLIIATLWTAPAARAEAELYYLGKRRGLPAQQIDNALFMIGQAATRTSGLPWGALERGIWTDQSTITPGFIAITGLEAMFACSRSPDLGGTTFDACLDRALSPGTLSRWPVTSP